ncbi:ABC transporter permease [Acidicapsa acidisoli]|uniref:ABC transporter permease n=1 Tax=Acidicapsa acidisoli TaxID=1615681 RepID=UPI0021DFAE10|nr:ABC transporter permease [Acidicapsa acidisoli]
MNSFLHDIRYAMRQLIRAPGFAATVVITLALGIGANTAIFTIFDQVLLRMLPVQNPKELVRFEWKGGFSGSASSFGGDIHNYFSYPMYKDLRDRNSVFTGISAGVAASVGVSWHDQAENKDAEVVSGNYFSLLDLKPAVGRLFTDADDTAKNADPVVVLGYDYWRIHFNASPDVAGKTLLINGHPFTIVGVAPDGFNSAFEGNKPGVFLPISMVEVAMPWVAPRDDLNNHKSVWLTLIARLKPGVTRQQAESSLSPLWYALRAQELTGYQSASAHFKDRFLNQTHLSVVDDSTGFMPGRDDLRTPLLVLMGMVGVLAAMCAVNVATLLLLRAAGRVREISMRYALGAARTRIISQLLVEGGVLGACGAIAGVALSPLIARTLVRLMTGSDDITDAPYSTAVDGRILGFTLVLSILVTLAFSAAPALQFLRPRLAETLRQNTGTASRKTQLFRKVAVGFQITLTVLLLGGAGLFLRTLTNLRAQNIGFEITHLINFGLDPSIAGYGEDRVVQVETSALDALREVPGVQHVAGTSDPEISGDSTGSNFTVQGHVAPEEEDMNFESPRITPDYFATLQQPLLAGREFSTADVKGSTKVAVVNLTFAKRFYGSPQNAMGRLLGEGQGNKTKLEITIVGVVGDIKHQNLRDAPRGTVYQPYLQQDHPGGLRIYAFTAQRPELIESAIRNRIHGLDPKLVVDGMRTMQEQVDRSVSDQRALALLAASFSALALLMTSVGLYGVLAFATAQRTREIGVRMALGAQRSNVIVLVLREMALTAIIGVAVALPAAFGLSRLVVSQLYGVQPGDPLTLLACILICALMLILAAAIPARRAASVDPMEALRSE